MQSHQSQGWSFAKSGQNTTLEEGVIFWQSHFVYKRHAHTHPWNSLRIQKAPLRK